MSKDQYDSLLKKLGLDECVHECENAADSCPPDVEDYPDLAGDSVIIEEIPLPEYPFELYFYELNMILESGIFRDGQFHPYRYKSYQINDLQEFIWLLCQKIEDFRVPVDKDIIIASQLSNLVEAIEQCGNTIRSLFGKRESTQIDALKVKINTWLNTPEESPQEPIFIITERMLSDYFTDLFKKHIHAPKPAISVGVSKLLKLFNIDRKPKTIAMREYRKRKSLSEK